MIGPAARNACDRGKKSEPEPTIGVSCNALEDRARSSFVNRGIRVLEQRKAFDLMTTGDVIESELFFPLMREPFP